LLFSLLDGKARGVNDDDCMTDGGWFRAGSRFLKEKPAMFSGRIPCEVGVDATADGQPLGLLAVMAVQAGIFLLGGKKGE